jgi:hypothetical protein
MNWYAACNAPLIRGMTDVSVADLVPTGDRSYHQQAQVHPTVKDSAAIARRVMGAMLGALRKTPRGHSATAQGLRCATARPTLRDPTALDWSAPVPVVRICAGNARAIVSHPDRQVGSSA